MKNRKTTFLFLKIYCPILIIVALVAFLLFLLTSTSSSILSYFEIPGIKDINGLLKKMESSMLLLIILSTFAMGLILIRFRKINSDVLFNSGNIYLDTSYFHLIIAKVLGYKKISLVRIPIALQYKIIINDLFENVVADVHDEKERNVVAKFSNESYESDEVNLILSDTYKVKIEQLPETKKNLTMVWIDSKVDKPGNRIYNPKFVKEVESQIYHLAQKYKRINIFSHTNTHHNKEIIKSCFKKGGRGEFQMVYVFQYCSNTSKFNELGIKVK